MSNKPRRSWGGKRLLRGLRGIVGADVATRRADDYVSVWEGAQERIISFGVGMSAMSKNLDIVRKTARRGIEVHFVMTDPAWLRSSPVTSALVDDFYGRKQFVNDFSVSHAALAKVTEELNTELGEQRVHLHTYRSFVNQGAAIADPGDKAWGYIEFHTYARDHDRFRLLVRGDDGREGVSLIKVMISSISELAGYDFNQSVPAAIQR
jgi:hypothetical protein